MVWAKVLLSAVESALLGPSPPEPEKRIELMHALRSSIPSFRSLFSYPAPKASDRAQVQSKEVRLPDSPPISLDDQDVQIALKLSDDLNLNEINCVSLLVSANQEWGLSEREPLEIYRLTAGLWYSERRDAIASLFSLLQAVVLDQRLEADLLVEIQGHLEDLFNSGLRQRLITLIKELNRDEPAGLGGPTAERYVLDYKGALVEREAVVCRERVGLGHCLVLSSLIVRMSPKDVKDVFSILKDCAVEAISNEPTFKLQVIFSLLFSLVITFISDALSALPNKNSVLSSNISFRHEFQELVMAVGNDINVEGFLDVIRLGWTVHLMLIQDQNSAREALAGAASGDLAYISSCLELICSNNVFQFLLDRILQTAAYQNDDEDMIYIYNAYMHKLMMCFLSHPLARDKVKQMKDKAMSALSPYLTASSDQFGDNDSNLQQSLQTKTQPFVSLLQLVSEIYQFKMHECFKNTDQISFANYNEQREPELLSGNEVLWTFVNFAGEDHTNIQTLVAFLRMLGTLACSEEGASKVYELLQGKTFHTIGWNTLFDCLTIYEQKFKQALQSTGTMLLDFQEGDAKVLVAYLAVLQKVMENGNHVERKKWFPDIEPLFKLLSYENVPPYLKGAMRNAIASFIHVSPMFKDTIWSFLEQYDLPVVVGPNSMQQLSTQVYDMQFELNEIEARTEKYPSTISFLNLVNGLITEERDVSDGGRRFVGIFRILSMYDVKDEDIKIVVDQSQTQAVSQAVPFEMQLPVLELLKDFMSGKTVFRNIMGILSSGVNAIIYDRTTQTYGQLLEKAVNLSLDIIILVLERDLYVADFWRPLYQPVDIILSQDHNQIVVLLEFVRYEILPQIQLCSVKIMSILSSRMVGLVQLLLKSNASKYLIMDYASCLESRSEESQIIENTKDDVGVLIIQLLMDNISRPAPNITHLLLKFDVDTLVERTVLQPKYHYSCLKVILDILEKLSKPDVNALLHEFGFQLLYELCCDPLTGGPMIDLLSTRKYRFFCQHLDTIGIAPLPKRNNNQVLRISSLHQRAWLLKLLALELHVSDMGVSSHREACSSILTELFNSRFNEFSGLNGLEIYPKADLHVGNKSKVLALLEVVQFRIPDTSMKCSQLITDLKCDLRVEEILRNSETSEKGGVYYYSERVGSSINPDIQMGDLREPIQQILRWGWKYNKNLEEEVAQLHMLTAWSQIVEVSVSRRLLLLEDRSQILYEVLDASLTASASPDCSLKMATMLSQVALTCMAKLQDERFLCPGGINSDNVTYLDVILGRQLPNGACHSILLKLLMAIQRNASSEFLRRRQYALLLSYFQYCRSMLDPGVPASILNFLLHEEQDGGDDLDLQKVDREHAELAQANFSMISKEAQSVLDLLTKDALQGNEAGKAVSLHVLDTLISIDQERYFLNQLQSRGFVTSCLKDISSFSYQESFRRNDSKAARDLYTEFDKHQLVTPVLRLVFGLTSLVDSSDLLEVKNKIVREVIDFVKGHQSLFDQILREDVFQADDLTLEQISLVVSILTKVWPYEENDNFGFVQELFAKMCALFPLEDDSSGLSKASQSLEKQRNSELAMCRLRLNLCSYLYILVTKKSLRLQVSDGSSDYRETSRRLQPTLSLLVDLLNSVAMTLGKAAEDKSLFLNKIQDINELSRQEVDEIINMFVRQDCVSSFDNIRKSKTCSGVDFQMLCGKLLPALERFELLNEVAEESVLCIMLILQFVASSSDRSMAAPCSGQNGM
ncbi:hypothetical protein QJS10_CPA07g00690 [Acorus calamus]|uniref:Nuclear pore complex protein NUP205 n=1 Tax=Acorus calamus TaxID=4465 RepID=A0AAV9EEV9_ACOCL|nr:hypothetical protein QJS10_CPA07g00690 [Acorus calamus]